MSVHLLYDHRMDTEKEVAVQSCDTASSIHLHLSFILLTLFVLEKLNLNQ